MRKSLVALLFLLVAPLAYATPEMTIGTGLDARIGRDVNPDYYSSQAFGQLYGEYAIHPWSFLMELEFGQTNGNNGNYSVKNSTYTTMAWARYEPWYGQLRISPFAGAGLGWQFHDTESKFGSARDEGWSDGGGIAAISGGAMATFFKHWNVESELRLAKFQMQSDVTFAFLLRTGYTF